jgi:outer membrane protein, multidrug efflux system
MLLRSIEFLSEKCLFFCLSVMLSGCSFIPVYERPPLPIAETYPREECTQNCSNIRQLCWQDFFTDPALQQLIALGLDNNRDLRIAIGRIYEARAVFGHSWADLFPTLNGNAAGLRTRFPGDILSSTFSAFSPPPTTGTPSAPSNPPIFLSAYLAALSTTWEIDFWGRIRSLNEAALEEYLATEEAEHATYISLIGEIANAYLMENELNELVSIAQKTVESRQKSYHLMKRRFEEGSSSKYEAIQAQTLLQQAKADLTVLERKRELNWNAMTLLVGTPITPDNTLLSQIEPYFIEKICPGLPSELLCNRPDVLAAEYRLKAANANIGAAKAAFFPAISLTGAYGSASSDLNNLFHPGSKFWAYFPSISVPIFDWGRNLSDLGFAKARQNIAVSEYERTIQVAFREVADALTERTWIAEQIAIQTETLAAQSERARLAWIRYQHGTSPYLEFLDAERDRFSAEQDLVQTRRAFLTSGINLFTALGGGYCRCP